MDTETPSVITLVVPTPVALRIQWGVEERRMKNKYFVVTNKSDGNK